MVPGNSTPDISDIPVDAENNPFLVWLVGMMACGKSTVAKILEGYFGAGTVDMDTLIAEKNQRSIPDFFQTPEGIAEFRLREMGLVVGLSINPLQRYQIISTGGGAPCFHHNMDQMIRSGLVVYLKGSPAALAQRTYDQDMRAGKSLRPILAHMDVPARTAKIIELMGDRGKIYGQAHITVDTDKLRPDEVANAIMIEKRRLFQK